MWGGQGLNVGLTCLQVCFRCQVIPRLFLATGQFLLIFPFPSLSSIFYGFNWFLIVWFDYVYCLVLLLVTTQQIFLKHFRCSWFSVQVTVSLLLLTKEKEYCQKDDISFVQS